LTGKQLGQFHIDFNLKDADSEIYATKSIFLGKKSYIDMLESTNKKGETITGYHYRMKGCTVAGLEDKAYRKYDNDMFKLYTRLIDNEMKLTMNPEGKRPMFEYSDNAISTVITGKCKKRLNFNKK
jgi:hypothetical protein